MDELRDIPKSVRVLPCPPTALRKFGSVSSVGLASGFPSADPRCPRS